MAGHLLKVIGGGLSGIFFKRPYKMGLVRKTTVMANLNQFIEVCFSKPVQGTLKLYDLCKLFGRKACLRHKIAFKSPLCQIQLFK